MNYERHAAFNTQQQQQLWAISSSMKMHHIGCSFNVTLFAHVHHQLLNVHTLKKIYVGEYWDVARHLSLSYTTMSRLNKHWVRAKKQNKNFTAELSHFERTSSQYTPSDLLNWISQKCLQISVHFSWWKLNIISLSALFFLHATNDDCRTRIYRHLMSFLLRHTISFHSTIHIRHWEDLLIIFLSIFFFFRRENALMTMHIYSAAETKFISPSVMQSPSSVISL